MPDFVRIRAENGYNVTVSKEFAEANGLEPLDPEKHPAVDGNGRPLPEEPSTPTAKKVADKVAASQEVSR
jgi:hypothetical protein